MKSLAKEIMDDGREGVELIHQQHCRGCGDVPSGEDCLCDACRVWLTGNHKAMGIS